VLFRSDLGVHLVDAALWILEFPTVVGATGRLYSGGRPFEASTGRVEDFAAAQIDLATGASLSLSCSWNLAAGRDAVIRLACYGTRGGAAVENVDGSFYDFRALRYRGTSTEVLTDARESWGGRAIVSWADCLRRGAGFDPEAEQFVDVAHALDMVYAS